LYRLSPQLRAIEAIAPTKMLYAFWDVGRQQNNCALSHVHPAKARPPWEPRLALRLAAATAAIATAASAAAEFAATAAATQNENDDNNPPAATAAHTVSEHIMYSIPPSALRLSDLISWFMFPFSLVRGAALESIRT